jgi:hypothetical protein
MPYYGSGILKYGDTSTTYGAMPSTTSLLWVIQVDWAKAGVFDGTNEASRCTGVHTQRGRKSILKMDADGKAVGFQRVDVGLATVILDNSDGRYDAFNTSSPIYPNCQPGRYINIQNQNGSSGTRTNIFSGKIANIKPMRDSLGTDYVVLICEDGMRKLLSADVTLAVQQNIGIATAIGAILDYIGWSTLWGRLLDITNDVLPYWWASGKAADEIFLLGDRELGDFFIAASGAAVYDSRYHSAAPLLTLTQSDFLTDIGLPQPWEVVRNKVTVTGHPRSQQATGVIWSMVDKPFVANGQSLTIFPNYMYNSATVPAINVVPPVITTDYTMNTAQDGSGTNLSSGFSVSLTDLGQTGILTYTNNSGSDGYITLGQLRGNAVTAPYPVSSIKNDAASQNIYEVLPMDLNLQWLQDTAIVPNIAAYEIDQLAGIKAFPSVKMEGRPDIQFTPDLFDFVNVSLLAKGLAATNYQAGYIEHETLTDNLQAVRTTWYLEPVAAGAGNYWQFPAWIDASGNFPIFPPI